MKINGGFSKPRRGSLFFRGEISSPWTASCNIQSDFFKNELDTVIPHARWQTLKASYCGWLIFRLEIGKVFFCWSGKSKVISRHSCRGIFSKELLFTNAFWSNPLFMLHEWKNYTSAFLCFHEDFHSFVTVWQLLEIVEISIKTRRIFLKTLKHVLLQHQITCSKISDFYF